MEKNQIDSELKLNESPDALWEKFEKTGSVKAFLRYVDSAKNSKELVPTRLPS